MLAAIKVQVINRNLMFVLCFAVFAIPLPSLFAQEGIQAPDAIPEFGVAVIELGADQTTQLRLELSPSSSAAESQNFALDEISCYSMSQEKMSVSEIADRFKERSPVLVVSSMNQDGMSYFAELAKPDTVILVMNSDPEKLGTLEIGFAENVRKFTEVKVDDTTIDESTFTKLVKLDSGDMIGVRRSHSKDLIQIKYLPAGEYRVKVTARLTSGQLVTVERDVKHSGVDDQESWSFEDDEQ